MKKYYFYAHAGSGNHGCEAIVRSSISILDQKITLFSSNINQDKKYGINAVVEKIYDYKGKSIKKYSIPWLISRLQTKITKSIDKEIFYRKKEMFSCVKKGDIWLSIGGDNYCYQGTNILSAERQNLQNRGAKVVLWGCSVEPSILSNKAIVEDISSYDLITARESISYNALKSINQNTVLIADPAFTLKPIELPLPTGWMKNKMIGINISPLILSEAKDSAFAFKTVRNLMKYILDNTDFGIALIPHVISENNNDLLPLIDLYKEFKRSKRIVLIEDANCMELKGYISRCRFFIGARTHATIAAYSTCVPTIAIGYSVKAKGIAFDLFGTSEKFVLPIQDLDNPFELQERFTWLLENENYIRNHLKQIMPSYINKAYLAKRSISNLL